MQDEWVADWNTENDRREEFDPAITWYPQRVVNERERARAWTLWKYTAAHEKKPYCNIDFTSFSDKRSDEHPFHFLDGVHVAMTRDGDPEDRWYEKSVDLKKSLDLLGTGLLRPDDQGPDAGNGAED